MTDKQHDSEAGNARRDISPDGTHVRMSLARFISVVIGIAMAVGTTVGIYLSVRWHTANTYIHLDPDFREKHGPPVGTRDLELSKESTEQAINTIVKVHIDELARTINAGRARR